MHPILFQTDGGFFIGTYGALIALGLLACVALAAWRARRHGISGDQIIDMTTVAVFFGFIAARVTFLFQNPDLVREDFLGALLSRNGFVFQGGFIGGVVSLALYVRWKKISPWFVGDLAAIGVPLAHAFGRFGCHFAGCCHGGACTVPWLAIQIPAFQMPDGSLAPNAYMSQLYDGTITSAADHSNPIWPVQLFEAGGLFLICGAILWWGLQRQRPAGLAFGIYLLSYGSLRFLLEFLRGDEGRGVYFNNLLSFGQILGITGIIAGVIVIMLRRNAAPTPLVAVPAPDPNVESGPSRPKRRSTGTGTGA